MKVLRNEDESVYVLFPPLRVSCGDAQIAPDALRDALVLNLAAALLRRGDDFARQCLSQTGAARAASLRGRAPAFHDPVAAGGNSGLD